MLGSSQRAKVRAVGRAARRGIVGDDRSFREAALVAHLRSVHVLRAPSVGVFVAHDGEPDLQPFVEMLWARGQTVALPVLEDDPSDGSMCFRTWRKGDTLVSGRYGIAIPPPGSGSDVAPECLLVPATAFDSVGNRMGRGAGYFDRYLAAAECQIVGVGFEAQRVEHLVTEEHDVAMPIMVTDLGVRYLW